MAQVLKFLFNETSLAKAFSEYPTFQQQRPMTLFLKETNQPHGGKSTALAPSSWKSQEFVLTRVDIFLRYSLPFLQRLSQQHYPGAICRMPDPQGWNPIQYNIQPGDPPQSKVSAGVGLGL